MRAWLRSFGYEFRRFPRWLHVFNVLCASALALIASAGLYFLTPLSAARRSYVAGGRAERAGGELRARVRPPDL